MSMPLNTFMIGLIAKENSQNLCLVGFLIYAPLILWVVLPIIRYWHERSVFQSVAVQAVDWHNDSGPLFSIFFSSLPLFFLSPSQPFLIQGVH